MQLGNPGRRLRFGLAIVLLLFAALAGRLIHIQATSGAAYAALAAEQRTVRAAVVAPRGAILDRDGVPLAHSVPARAVYADPKFVKDPKKNAHALAGLLGVPESELLRKMAVKKGKKGHEIRFVYLARGQDPEIGEAVSELKLPGTYVLSEQRRDVPGHDLGANLIGFTGLDGYGLSGLEASYDDVLKGVDGKREFEVSVRGQEIPNGYRKVTRAKAGQDMQLTIDSDLQFEAQKILTNAMQDVGARTGAATIMDVHSGEILAMASSPTYDAANPTTSDEKTRVDMATSSVVEPGSVHKAITFAAGLETGVIRPESVLTVPPTIEKGDVTFRDTHEHDTVGMTLPGMLAQSSNVGSIMIADQLGPDRLYEYQRKFGLGSRTGVGLPAESEGLIQPPARWSGPSAGGIPIGLGVAVTPLQMTSVYATIANGGVRVVPRLVRGVSGADGDIKERKPVSKRVMSSENAAALRQMLEAVPTSLGTAPKAAVPGYRVAGKTGTGLLVIDNKYAPGDVTSFIGMVPADSPRFVISVFAHVPHGSGGDVAAPTFAELASFALRHYTVAPTGTEPPPIRIYA